MNSTATSTTRPGKGLRALAALAFTAAAAAALTGCSTPAAAGTGGGSDCKTPTALVIITAVQENSNPGLPAEAGCAIDKALDAHAPISIIAEDGAPYTVQSRTVYDVTPGSATHDQDQNKARTAIITAISTAPAKTNGTNPLAAFAHASDLIGDTTGALIITTSPGLSDTSPLDLTDPSLAAADPKEVLAHLNASKSIPHLNADILWAGLGNNAGTQAPLPPAQKENYKNIWNTILTTAGAKTTYVPPASTLPAKNTNGHTVRPVPPTTATPIHIAPAGGTTDFPNTSPLGFKPDSTELRDPAAAATLAKDIATWLNADPHRTATITGTTASAGTEEGRRELSKNRADAIAALIGAAGVDRARITTNGAGNAFPGFEPDMADGTLDPVKAEHNRSVQITLTP